MPTPRRDEAIGGAGRWQREHWWCVRPLTQPGLSTGLLSCRISVAERVQKFVCAGQRVGIGALSRLLMTSSDSQDYSRHRAVACGRRGAAIGASDAGQPDEPCCRMSSL